MNINVKQLPGGLLPTYANEGDAGLDVYAREGGQIPPGGRRLIPLGFAIEIMPEFVGLISGRSGLASKKGIAIMGGVIDPSYRGEVHALLLNADFETFSWKAGERVAQMLILYCPRVQLVPLLELSESARGGDGFGSTGK